MPQRILETGKRTLDLSTPKIIGILNVTPDSFSDGGDFVKVSDAVSQAKKMVAEGASIIDIGGESTRPGADPVTVEEELKRVLPVVKAVTSECDVMISVDTSAPEVITECVAHGAHLWNDIRALQRENAVETAAKLGVAVCLMHMQGDPKTMQLNPKYNDVMHEVSEFLVNRAAVCEAAGIPPEKIIIDPGFGFGKTLEENYVLLAHLDYIKMSANSKYHLLSALSRKGMIGKVTHKDDPKDRVIGSVIGAFYSFMQGAHLVRVHDVAETYQALQMYNAIKAADAEPRLF